MSEPKTRCRGWTSGSLYRVRCKLTASANSKLGLCANHMGGPPWSRMSAAEDTGQTERDFIGRDYLLARLRTMLEREAQDNPDSDAPILIRELERRIPFHEPDLDDRAIWASNAITEVRIQEAEATAAAFATAGFPWDPGPDDGPMGPPPGIPPIPPLAPLILSWDDDPDTVTYNARCAIES